MDSKKRKDSSYKNIVKFSKEKANNVANNVANYINIKIKKVLIFLRNPQFIVQITNFSTENCKTKESSRLLGLHSVSGWRSTHAPLSFPISLSVNFASEYRELVERDRANPEGVMHPSRRYIEWLLLRLKEAFIIIGRSKGMNSLRFCRPIMPGPPFLMLGFPSRGWIPAFPY